jgi:hypothetical protein
MGTGEVGRAFPWDFSRASGSTCNVSLAETRVHTNNSDHIEIIAVSGFGW